MRMKFILTLIFGIAGLALLLWLGSWQVSRLNWKLDLIADVEARIQGDPVAIPAIPTWDEHRYLPVTATGIADDGVQVFASARGQGAGYRMISVFETDGRRLLLDRGFRRQDSHTDFNGPAEITITGNMHWPDELNEFTPPPEGNTWYARDLEAISMSLGTEPLLIVARTVTPDLYTARPVPLTTEGIPNDHLGYAITWFSLAFFWVVMTSAVLWRIRQRTL